MVTLTSEANALTPPSDEKAGGTDTSSVGGVDSSAPKANFLIVAIGASAGGLEAITKLIDALPDAPEMAFILIQHLDPTHKSLMADLLAPHTAMHVIEATDGAAIEADHVYTIPSGTYLSVSGNVLKVSAPEAPRGSRKPFDFLLKSLARGTEHPIAAIVLSGLDGDGSGGVLSIRERGGLVIAQDPTEAEYNSMPSTAIDTGLVDETLRIDQMPRALSTFAKTNASATSSRAANSGLTDVIEILRKETPHDFRLYKPGTLQRRVERRMALSNIALDAMPTYVALLHKDAGERELLAADLLINVTTFFRDPKTFDKLASQVIPDLVNDHDGEQPLRVWVAGCSSGEEAYSIAILFMEAIAGSKRVIKFQMFASDVDADAVGIAREGLYPMAVAVDITPGRLKRFFVHDERGYRANRELRDAIMFTVQNVLFDPPFSRLDLISCRNLLIYLTPRAQAKVISLFHFALRNRGILLLGSAETIGSMAGRFEIVAKAERIYRQIGQGRLRRSDLDVGAAADKAVQVRGGAEHAPTRASGFADLARRLVLETHAPAAVLIDRAGKCLYSLGPTDRYLQVASGYPSHDLLEMATPALRAKLRAAIGRVSKDNPRVFIGHSRIGATAFGIDVQSVISDGEELLLVAFIDDPASAPGRDNLASPATNARVSDLEHELALTRDELRSALDGLETSSQEQKAVNEEALSVNEEYQSTNEELLTSKEELQSLNEELTALNGQLQETLERQRSTADDLQNVLYSTDVATLFLDPDLNIRFFTPATRAIFNVIPGDIGRPLADLRSLAADDHLAVDARKVLNGAPSIGHEIEVPGGSWFMRRVLPYHTHDKKIEGVVITFADITERKSSAKALRATKREAELANIAKSRFLAAASHDLRQPLQSLSLVQALLAHSVKDAKGAKLVARLGQTLDAMAGMLNVLLDINQIEAGVVQPEPTDFPLDDLFGRMRDEFTYQAQAQHLELRVKSCALRVHSDPRLLEQMVRNLLANAMKYTRTGRIVLGCRRSGLKMRIEIWDTGIGIAEDELHTIFDEFHQIDNAARERSKGLGLGLSIVQRLAALLGHDIGVRSKLGKGSVFAIEVPLATHAALTPEVGIPDHTPATTIGKVIIVEDDPDVRDLLEQLLKAGGHRVRTAANGVSALSLVAKGAIRPDLVIADYNLPGAMDGLEVIMSIRKALDYPLPSIVLTGDISRATQARINASDCVLMSKPVKSQELIATIEKMLTMGASPVTVPAPALLAGADAVVIVVDDDVDVRRSIREVLEADGHKVEEFPDAESYLAAYRSDREGCLLLDAGLPGIGGIELLVRLQKMNSPMRTIMLTGNNNLTLAISAMKAGASDFIEKPVGKDALMMSIARVLAQSHDVSIANALEETAARQVAKLSPRQREIMDLVLAGHPNKNIAADLGISQRTVETHRASIMRTMKAKSLPELARQALAAERKKPTSIA